MNNVSAASAISRTVDLETCAREPIHVPGSIQPHGVLLAMTGDDFRITHVSNNAEAVLGSAGVDLIGTTLSELVAAEDLTQLRAALLDDLESANPLGFVIQSEAGELRFDAIVHDNGSRLIVELEPELPQRASFHSSYHAVRSSLNRLNAAGSLLDLAQRTAEEVRRITAFDRVMIYRFDADYNGEVIAEDRREDLEPFLGLHYPASDIPAQARALYERNWLRIITDVSYTPSPLLADPENDVVGPLDLSASVLRSVSPIHLEYLTNMGVRASMSVSLISHGKLWGLIACHHYSDAHRVPYATRAAAEFIGQTASVLISAKQEDEGYEAALLVRSVQTQLLDALARENGDVALALTHFQPTVADLVGATGAVLCLDGELERVGTVPDDAVLKTLTEWVWKDAPEFFATDALAYLDQRFEALAPIAAGVIAVPLEQRHRSWVMWFRPETPQSVTWAGDPRHKIVEEGEDGSVRLSPRKSFAAWTERLQYRALPWTDHELRGAAELGRRVEATLSRALQSQADTARVLQRGLTLAELPEVEGLAFEARYHPGDGGLVGGDWYDVVPLPDGRVAISIGDVAGHGLVAATTMGQLRSGLRAYLVEEIQPSVVIDRLNRLVHWLLPNDIATGVVAIFDPKDNLLRVSSAGHLPPVLVRNGRASLVQAVRAPALGISEQARYAESTLALHRGDQFVLYTDGLVESRRESLDVGFERLRTAAEQTGPFASLCERLLTAMHRDDSTDDIAILAMHVTP